MIDLKDPTKKIIDTIQKACGENRQLFAEEWARNERRLAGFTEQDVHDTGQTLDEQSPLPAEAGDARYAVSFNRTRGFFQRLLGRLMPIITHYQVLAASGGDDDKDAASTGAELLEARTSVDSGRDFEEDARAISYMFAGGPSYLRIEGNEDEQEVDVEAVLPFDVYYYPGIRRLSKSPAIVLVERLTKQDIERRFPELAQKVEELDEKWNTITPAQWPSPVDYHNIAGGINAGMYEVKRLFIKACKDYPEGDQRAILTGMDEEAAVWNEIGTADGEYPLEALSDVPMGPFYEDRGRMSISSPMQRVFDIALSKMVDLTIGAPQALVNFPPGTDANEEDWTNKAFMVSHSPDSLKPTVDTLDTLGKLPEIAAMASQGMDEVHSQHGPSRGKMPGSRTSGKALEESIAQDVAADEPLMAMLRRTMARVGLRILKEGQRVWPEAYTFHVLGRNKRFQGRAFKAANLDDGFSVRVLPDRGLPKNKVARMKMVSEFGKQGLLGDSIEARRAREMIEFPIDDDMLAAQPAEEQLIRQEEEKINQGIEAPVNWSDDHMLHRMRHKQQNTERLSQGEVDPRALEVAMQHDLMHAQKQQEELMASMPPQPAQGQSQGAQ